MQVEELRIRISAQIDGVQSSINRVRGQVQSLTNNFQNFSNSANSAVNGVASSSMPRLTQSVGATTTAMNGARIAASGLAKAFAPLMAVFAVSKIVSFGKECLNLASDLVEVQNVVDVSFGNMSQTVNRFAQECAESFGMSELSAKKFMGTLGSVLQSANISLEDSYVMASNITKRVADLSSFYNMSQDEAMTKMRSAIISGETEAIKSLGVNMTVANLQAYALSQGIQTAYQNMSQAEQVILRYNYAMQATSVAHMDYARTSDSFANRQRTLALRFDALKAKVGTFGLKIARVLLPVLEVALNVLDKLITGFGRLFGIDFGDIGESVSTKISDGMANGIGDGLGEGISGGLGEQLVDAGDKAKALSTPVSKVSKDLDKANKNTKGVKKNLKDATDSAKGLRKTLSGFDEINTLNIGDNNNLGGALDGLGGALGDLASAAGYAGKIGDGLGIASTKALDLSKSISDAYGSSQDLNKVFTETSPEMEGYFGNVALNMDQIKKVAKQIIDNKDIEKMAELTNKVNNMENLSKNIQDAKRTIDSYNWMISMGIELTEEDKKNYIQAVNQFVDDCNKYVKEQKEAVQLACQIVFGEGSEEEKEFTKFYTGVEGKLASLGKKIKEKVNEAWEDGILTLDEAKEIQNLTNQEYEIMQKLNEAQFEANLDYKVKTHFSGVDLTEESYDQLSKELQKQYDEYAKGLDDASLQLVVALKARLKFGEITQAEYDEEYTKIMNQVNEKKAQKQEEIVKFKINTALEMIINNKDVDKKVSEVFNDVSKKVNEQFSGMASTLEFGSAEDFNDFFRTLNDKLSSGFSDIPDDLKPVIKKMVKDLEPQEKELNELKKKYEETGQAVPESVSDGLTDINTLKAMTGDVNAIYYLIGNQLSDNEDFKTAIKTAKQNGIYIPDSIIDGMNSKKADLSNGASGLLKQVSTTIDKDKSIANSSSKKGDEAGKSLGSSMNSKDNRKKASDGANGLLGLISNVFSGSKIGDTIKKYAQSGGSQIGWINCGDNRAKARNGSWGLIDIVKNIAKNSGLWNKFQSAGKSGGSGLKNGLNDRSKRSGVWSAASNLVSYATSAASSKLSISGGKSQKFKTMGRQSVSGYNSGVSEAKGSSNGFLSSWINGMISWVKSKLGIHSPSRLFKSFGSFTVEGFNNGISNNISSTKRIMDKWSNTITDVNTDLLTPNLPNDFTGVVNASTSYSMSKTTLDSIADVTTQMSSQLASEILKGTDKQLNVTLQVGQDRLGQVTASSINALTKRNGYCPINI